MGVWLQVKVSQPVLYFEEIDHEIISTVIPFPSTELFKRGCCQLLAKVCAGSTGLTASSSLPRKGVLRWADCLATNIAVNLGRKAAKQNKTKTQIFLLAEKFLLAKTLLLAINLLLAQKLLQPQKILPAQKLLLARKCCWHKYSC